MDSDLRRQAELVKIQLHATNLLQAIYSRIAVLLTVGALSAALLVVASLNPASIVNNGYRWLLVILLANIPFSLLGYLLNHKIGEEDASQRLDPSFKNQQTAWQKFISYWPWISSIILSLATVWMIIKIILV